MKMNSMRGALVLAAVLAGCGDDGNGNGEGKVRVLLTAEETITDGLEKGPDVENTHDYAVSYTK